MYKKAQSITEYAILLSIVIGGIAGMQVYLKRAMNARLKSGADAYTASSASFDVEGQSVTFESLSQYEPYYLVSKGESYQESVQQEHLGDGTIENEIVSEIVASASGGYRAEEAGKTIHETRDKIWTGATE